MAAFFRKLAGVGKRLPEIARRRGDKVVLLNQSNQIVGRAKFEAARMLKSFARYYQINSEVTGKFARGDQGRRANGARKPVP